MTAGQFVHALYPMYSNCGARLRHFTGNVGAVLEFDHLFDATTARRGSRRRKREIVRLMTASANSHAIAHQHRSSRMARGVATRLFCGPESSEGVCKR